MQSVPYESLVPNIDQVEVDGAQVHVTWKCPASGNVIGKASAHMVADQSVSGRVKASVKRSVASEIIYGAARALSSLLGGAAGRVVGNAVYTAANDVNTKMTSGVDYSEASRQAAVVTAFESVKDRFAWDENTRRFVARSSAL